MVQAYTMPMHADHRLRSTVEARALMKQHRVPMVLEVMLARATNIAMGAEIDSMNEFDPVTASIEDAPSSVVEARLRPPPHPSLGWAEGGRATRCPPARSYNLRILNRFGAPPCRASTRTSR